MNKCGVNAYLCSTGRLLEFKDSLTEGKDFVVKKGTVHCSQCGHESLFIGECFSCNRWVRPFVKMVFDAPAIFGLFGADANKAHLWRDRFLCCNCYEKLIPDGEDWQRRVPWTKKT